MKLFWTLVLCGVTCCLARPKCKENEIWNCFKHEINLDMTEEDLQNFCSRQKCIIEVIDRCQIPSEKYLNSRKQAEITVNALCSKTSPIRQKYLDNIKCINKNMNDLIEKCFIVGGLETNHDEFCSKIPGSLKCIDEILTKSCGQDASEAYLAIHPSYEYFECPR